MAVRPIVKMGTPSLFEKSAPWPAVKFDSPELHALLTDMKDSMAAANGAGLAAPQIGENVRVVIFEETDNPRYPNREPIAFTVLINPQLAPTSEEMVEDWEGCLSVPGMRGQVARYPSLRYTGFDQFGDPVDRTVEGFHARVVQHECDHLIGTLYPMRIRDFTRFGFTEIFFPGLDAPADD